MRGTAQLSGLDGAVDPDGNVWLSEGGQVTDRKVSLTRDIRALIFAPGGFLKFEGGHLQHQGIELAGRVEPAAPEPPA